MRFHLLFAALLCLALGLASNAGAAIDPALVARLAAEDNDEKVAAIAAIVATGDPDAMRVLKGLADGELKHEGQEITINNRVRRELDSAMAALKLFAPDVESRRAAVRELSGGADEALLPLVKKALERETDAALKSDLALLTATLQIKGGDKAGRIAAIRLLGTSSNPATKTLLLPLADSAEADEDVRRAARDSLKTV